MRFNRSAPWLPPITSTKGPDPRGTHSGRGAGSRNARRTGVPVTKGWQAGSRSAASGRPTATRVHMRPNRRVTLPGIALLSCNTTVTPHHRAARIAGAAM